MDVLGENNLPPAFLPAATPFVYPTNRVAPLCAAGIALLMRRVIVAHLLKVVLRAVQATQIRPMRGYSQRNWISSGSE
jgi:hypothetical protein